MHLYYVIDFLKLAETGNFSAAADELYISQSSLSKHIQSLEKVLGVTLVNRNSRKVSLSEGGKLFLPYAKQLRDTFLKANRDIKNLISKDNLNFTLGCMPTMSFYNLMDIVADFKDLYPKINIVLSEFAHTTEKEINGKLLDHEYEMVFCDLMFIKSSRIEHIDYCSDYLVAVLHRDHPLAVNETINLTLLENEPFAFLFKPSTTYYYSCKACEKAGFKPKIKFLGSRVESVLECVSNNMGIGLLMNRFTSLIRNNDVVVRKITPTVKRTISLGRVSNKNHSMASNQFWDFFSSQRTVKNTAVTTAAS